MQLTNLSCDRGDCKRQFRSNTELELHLRLHDNNLLRCFFCPWTGAKGDKLAQHVNHHFKFRPINCSSCNETFYTANHRKVHEERYHEKIIDRYQCNFCTFKHYTMDGIRFHKIKNHAVEKIGNVL